MADGFSSQGVVLKIGQGDAESVVPGSDTFDTIGLVTDVPIPGVDSDEIDVSHLGSTWEAFILGLKRNQPVSVAVNMDPSDTGQASAKTAADDQEKRNIRITLTDTAATQIDFVAYVKSFTGGATVNDKISGEITLRPTGAVTWS